MYTMYVQCKKTTLSKYMSYKMTVLIYLKEGNLSNLKPSKTDLERVNEHFVSSKSKLSF